ncbi:hypothetical protein [Okibacterium fritillariae]|uniref:Uncharacterized protein n=1 Tax=Okibacterium fritillariae TaxID=123320 RepID=A0A1T5IXK5_9MICO|nr:hypothetical protein [Okibacterium fritillariae]SKC43673.1 hypothetical protein SAMN06309945_0943 [Okibacterium fritillariae]
MLTVLPRSHRDIVDYLRREFRSNRGGSPLALESLPPGRSFAGGAIGREFGLHPTHAPRVDDVLIRLGIAADNDDGTVVIAGVCLASLRRVLETAAVLYGAVLDCALAEPSAKSELLEHALAVLCAWEVGQARASASITEWVGFLDALEERCRNPLLRTLIADVRLQIAFFVRPFLEDLVCDGCMPGLVIMADGIRDNDPLIAVEGFQLTWRALDTELGRMAEVRSAQARAISHGAWSLDGSLDTSDATGDHVRGR